MDGMLNEKNLKIVIPARYSSHRLPFKLLEKIHGYPIIYWTYQRALLSQVGDVIVAADHPQMYDTLRALDIPFVETSKDCKNGTERVAAVANLFKETEFFMNIQGDEPLLNPQTVRDMYEAGLQEGCFKTAVSAIPNGKNQSEVKVAISFDDRIRFASRKAIPFSREDQRSFYKIHGTYTYSREVLQRFVSCVPGPLEILESVEQLRCIEHDIPLYAVKTAHTERSVDTLDDLLYMRAMPVERFINP
jgi:3-deoxy-manno-octulosonate cytidylyltransferase (CMP-KDO synthetase)